MIVGGSGSINEAPITGESVPKDKATGAGVFAGTVLESGAIDVKTERVGGDTMFARIVKLVEEAEDSQAPVQRLADRVAAWLIPVVLVFLVVVFLLTRDKALTGGSGTRERAASQPVLPGARTKARRILDMELSSWQETRD